MQIDVHGNLSVYRLAEDGKEELLFSEHNVIVAAGRQVFSRMLGGNAGAPLIGGSTFGNISDLVVTTMQLGISSTPEEESPNNTVGVAQVIFQPTITVSYPTNTSVMFSGVIPIIEAVGYTITEEALFLKNGLLFARKAILPGVVKDGAHALKFDHSFTFSVV